jgi:hypothetical protein
MDAAELPAIIYNVPGRTACNVLPETIETLADEDPRVVGVKEASGDISQVAELARRVAHRVALYSGNDDQVVPLMSLGGVGVISVLANVAPRDTSRMAQAFLEGKVDESRELQLRLLPADRRALPRAQSHPGEGGGGDARLQRGPAAAAAGGRVRRGEDGAAPGDGGHRDRRGELTWRSRSGWC